MGQDSHDVDIEVYGLDPEALKAALAKTGEVFAVGFCDGPGNRRSLRRVARPVRHPGRTAGLGRMAKTNGKKPEALGRVGCFRANRLAASFSGSRKAGGNAFNANCG